MDGLIENWFFKIRSRPFEKRNGHMIRDDPTTYEGSPWKIRIDFSEPEWTGSNTNDLTISKHTARFRNQKQHLKRQTSPKTVPETVMGRHDRCHDMMFYGSIECFWIKTTRHGRRHKSVRDPSRRVWKATTPAFRGLTPGSRNHRSGYENGDERDNQIVPPSVFSRELSMNTVVNTETTWATRLLSLTCLVFSLGGPSLPIGEREWMKWVMGVFNSCFFNASL